MGMAQEKEWQLGIDGDFTGTCSSFLSLNSVPFLLKNILCGNSCGVAKSCCWFYSN